MSVSRGSGASAPPWWPTLRRLVGTALAVGVLTAAACDLPAVPRVQVDPPASTPDVATSPTVVPAPPLPVVGNPFVGRAPHWRDDTSAARAAEAASGRGAELLARIAEVPTAVWLMPELHPVGEVGGRVHEVAAQAEDAGEVAVLVVYGIPDRDCISGFSRGGLSEAGYLDWVREVALAAGPGSVVVLEPDALASAGRCPRPVERLGLLGEAVGILSGAEDGPTTYLDAGHSNWLDVSSVVERLREVGVERVRGIALNVANHGWEHEEVAYGEAVVAALGGGHFVVDTGRAGAGPNGEWCNSRGRALGALPEGIEGAGPFDARLWIKPPGESDGTCGGGPSAGQFWPERAVELAVSANW